MIFKSFKHKTAFTSLVALTAFMPMSACDLANNLTKMDRSTNNEFQDFRDAMAPREVQSGEGASAGIPDLQSYVADDTQSMKSAPLVSLSINQSIPLREALFELAKQADFDIELDPRIKGSIIFTARNRPLDEVIDRICEISGLRYKINDNSIRIEIDTPYSKNYKIDYLSFVRSNNSTIKTDVSITSDGEASAEGGSSLEIASKAESDFWTELDTNLKQILSSNSSPSFLKTNDDPQISLTSSNPVTPPVPPIDGAALSETAPQAGTEDIIYSPQMVPQPTAESAVPALPAAAATESSSSASTVAGTATPPATPAAATPAPQPVSSQPVVPAQPPVLKVESLPTSASGNAGSANAVEFTPAYSINKQAGIVSVYANDRLHKQIANYLDDLRRSSTSQVLIEAKVLEVTLSDEFASGINWSMLDTLGDFSISASSFPKPSFDPAGAASFTFGFAGNDLSSFVSALSRFGTVHALASPRLSVLNNQAAVLNVARNQVYFEIDVTTTPSTVVGAPNTVTFESTAKSVPEGVIINVMPSIDLDRRTISMQVRPTITKIEDFVSDPVIGLNGGAIDSQIPIMNVQETDSVLNLKDKQMMVMGGLLQDSSKSEREGIPGASEIPVFGKLFSGQGDKVSKKELVVFIKATILDNAADSVSQADKDLYRTFGQDRRPHKF